MISTTISHYKILSKLGEGGMGVVYKAEDTKLGRLIALKFLPAHLINDEKAQSRLRKEAKAASKINHPNVCTIYDIKEYEDTHFIVMEYVDGETVKNKIKDTQLSISETVEYSEQICKALKAAHDKGITHRDIKSENIMINTDNMVKVMNFGLAKLKDEARQSRTSSTAGTIAYMAPEQIKGEDIDHRADIWATGVVIFEMLTGKFPFKGEYESAMSYSIVNTDPEPINIFRSEVPAELERARSILLFTYYDLAGVYAFRGEKDKAYENLRIFNQRQWMNSWMVYWIKNDPLFDSIRDEPEFQQIVRDVEAKYQAEHERVRKWLEEQGML